MRGRIILQNDFPKLIEWLRSEHEVIAPFRGRDRDSYFDVVSDDNKNDIAIHLPNPYYPPKRYVTPHIQKFLKYQAGEKVSLEEICEEKKRAIFGIRSCDVAGIFHLDRFYLGNAFKDEYYEALRSRLFIVNMVCTDPALDIDHDCFCVCADTGPAAHGHFDLQLMDLHNETGEFLAVAGTDAGEKLLAESFFKKASSNHVARRHSILEEVRKSFKQATSWYSAATRLITKGGIKDETWKHVGDRCLECGGCSYVCPTCTCFTVTDRPTGDGGYERLRMWDACALSGFTRMAGGHNPRKAVNDRRNRRFFRKLGHYFVQRELSQSCVGCGRCVRVCHGDVGMPSVVEILRRESMGSLAVKK